MTIYIKMMPYKPKIAAANIKAKRMIRKEIATLKDGIEKLAMAVNATTITIIGLTTPA